MPPETPPSDTEKPQANDDLAVLLLGMRQDILRFGIQIREIYAGRVVSACAMNGKIVWRNVQRPLPDEE